LALPWSIEINGSKIYFIAISFYRNIGRQNVWCDVGLKGMSILRGYSNNTRYSSERWVRKSVTLVAVLSSDLKELLEALA